MWSWGSLRHGLRGQPVPSHASAPVTSVAVRSELGSARPGCRGAARQGAVAARSVPRSAIEPSRAHLFKELKDPYFLGDEVGSTQSLGWVDAWTSRPSAYAVAAQTTYDVVAAVNFARENNCDSSEGGGHSYQGTSSAADSLPIGHEG